MKSDEVEQISNGNTKQTKTLKQINNTTTTKINLPYNKSLWNQNRYQARRLRQPPLLSRQVYQNGLLRCNFEILEFR